MQNPRPAVSRAARPLAVGSPAVSTQGRKLNVRSGLSAPHHAFSRNSARSVPRQPVAALSALRKAQRQSVRVSGIGLTAHAASFGSSARQNARQMRLLQTPASSSAEAASNQSIERTF